MKEPYQPAYLHVEVPAAALVLSGFLALVSARLWGYGDVRVATGVGVLAAALALLTTTVDGSLGGPVDPWTAWTQGYYDDYEEWEEGCYGE